ncbi:MAG: FdtA/QdtA family cupin domain-containing protein [Gammaproteobacteria bacterium]
MSIKNCKLIDLPKHVDDRGLLSFIESNQHIPFEIKRIFYLYDVPAQKSRGAHAHKTLQQFILSLGDSLDVEIDDGREKQRFHLNKPWKGLYIPPMIWTSVENFQSKSICMVLASDSYQESDYYRNYENFLQAINTTISI